MTIKELKIKGYKSIGEITLHSPNPFTVFVGANGAGKIEFNVDLGGVKPRFHLRPKMVNGSLSFGNFSFSDYGESYRNSFNNGLETSKSFHVEEYFQLTKFTRLFIGKQNKINTVNDVQLAFGASNLESVLKRIFRKGEIKAEIIEILQLLIPEFESIDIVAEELSGTDNLAIYEKTLKKPLTKRLISDGTYNILAILAAIYQSDTPQFLCIEEPENGLNPKVVRELVNIIRTQCTEKGHYIWLNTHSQTLVSELRPEEIILVDKVNGMTQTKQVTDVDLHGLRMDEALLTNSLGGGIPW
jgi:predicted ATPase